MIDTSFNKIYQWDGNFSAKINFRKTLYIFKKKKDFKNKYILFSLTCSIFTMIYIHFLFSKPESRKKCIGLQYITFVFQQGKSIYFILTRLNIDQLNSQTPLRSWLTLTSHMLCIFGNYCCYHTKHHTNTNTAKTYYKETYDA